MRIYIAAPLAAAPVAEELASELGARGHIVVSGWHALDTEDSDPLDGERRARILANNLADLDKAHGLIALTHFTDVVGRGTYAEIGYALARGLPVAWVQDGMRGRCIFDAHPLVQRFQVDELGNQTERVLADWARLHEPPRETIADEFSRAFFGRYAPPNRIGPITRTECAGPVVVHNPTLPPDATKGGR